MALGIRKKASKPQVQAAPPAAAPKHPNADWTVPGDWREQLTAARPKGRFTYGENIKGPRR